MGMSPEQEIQSSLTTELAEVSEVPMRAESMWHDSARTETAN